MAYSPAALALRVPSVKDLPRAGDRVSYLFLDAARVTQERTGVVADVAAVGDRPGGTAVLPVAELNVLLLGPGCSITAPALTTLHRSGCTVVITASDGVSGYAASTPLTGRGAWAQAQARVWSDPGLRLEAARVLYRQQLVGVDIPENAPLRVLRGTEGAFLRSVYRAEAKRLKLPGWKREADSEKATDPVNPLLNLANSILYGTAASVCSVLGLSPALGIIHSGAANAFLFDLADLFKATGSVPLAFRCATYHDPAARLRGQLREFLHRNDVFGQMFDMVDSLFGPHIRSASADVLLDEEGAVPGMRNYAASGKGDGPCSS